MTPVLMSTDFSKVFYEAYDASFLEASVKAFHVPDFIVDSRRFRLSSFVCPRQRNSPYLSLVHVGNVMASCHRIRNKLISQVFPVQHVERVDPQRFRLLGFIPRSAQSLIGYAIALTPAGPQIYSVASENIYNS